MRVIFLNYSPSVNQFEITFPNKRSFSVVFIPVERQFFIVQILNKS